MLRASAACEAAGFPSSSLVATAFVEQAKATRVGLGYPNLPWATLVGHPAVQTPEKLRENVSTVTVPEIIANLTGAIAAGSSASAEPGVRDVVFKGGFSDLNQHFIEREWSDGLPIVPPTRARIEAFLAHTKRDPEEVLGIMLPDNRAATIWSVAVNGVMAGCKPEYMPVLVALAEAMADPEYGVEHSGNTPGGETLIILNGPIVKSLGFNYTQGVMRDGFQPNTTVGRFWRLYLRNVAGFLLHKTDKATYGNTWRVAIAENDDAVRAIGWKPLSVDQGFSDGDSTVTIARYTGGGMASSMSGSKPEGLLDYLADGLIKNTFWQIMFSVGTGYGKLRPLALITPIIAETIAASGWSKDDVKRYLFEKARIPAWEFERTLRDWTGKPVWSLTDEARKGNIPADMYAASDDPNRLVPIVWEASHFMVVVTGDPGRTSGYMFGHNGQLGFPVTKKIAV
ncbi:MAG: UGSC family (seleno)protein [Pseudomonadota bacterium]